MTLTIDNLSKRYGDTVALDGVSFEVRPGELFGFVGSNGAGKTTTMRITLGVLAADSGEVRIDGKPVDLEMRRNIGYMPEERGLYPKMKVGKQLSYLARLHGLSKSEASEAVQRWTERLGIAERLGDTVDACRSATSSACSSPRLSCTTRRSSSSTSRSPASTR